MTYETANKLKENNFPMLHRGRFMEGRDVFYVPKSDYKMNEDPEELHVPFLDELVTACMGIGVEIKLMTMPDGRFRMLTNVDDGNGNMLDFAHYDLREMFALFWLEMRK